MKILFFFVAILLSTCGFSQRILLHQTEVDSAMSNPQKSPYDFDAIRNAYKNQPELLGINSLYARLAHSRYIEGEKDSAYYFAEKSIAAYYNAEYPRTIDEKQLPRAYYFKARVLADRRDYYNSIKFQIKAIELAEKFNYQWIGYYYSSLATNHLKMGDRTKALEVNHKLVNDKRFMDYEGTKIYNRMGLIHSYFQQYDSAHYYFKKALLAKKVTPSNRFSTHMNIGDIYRKNKQEKQALFHYKKADSLSLAANLENNSALVNRAYLYQKSNQYQKAIALYEGAIENASQLSKISTDDRDIFGFAFDRIIECYETLERYTQAATLAKKKSDFLEKHYTQLLEEQLSDLTLQYEVRQKDASISALEEKNSIQSTILSQRNIIIYGVIGITSLLGILGYLFYRKRVSDNKLRIANIEQRLLRSQLNPHFLFNALNTIVSMSSLKSEKTVPYTRKLSSLLRSILENSREEFISLKEELTSVQDYLELESNFSQKFQYKIDIEDCIDVEEILVPPMFMQPFVENSIQHGFQGDSEDTIKIRVLIDTNKRSLQYEITDNGIGRSKAIKIKANTSDHKSLSGKILQERLTLYSKAFKTKAFYKIQDSTASKGTHVHIVLPYLEDH